MQISPIAFFRLFSQILRPIKAGTRPSGRPERDFPPPSYKKTDDRTPGRKISHPQNSSGTCGRSRASAGSQSGPGYSPPTLRKIPAAPGRLLDESAAPGRAVNRKIPPPGSDAAQRAPPSGRIFPLLPGQTPRILQIGAAGKNSCSPVRNGEGKLKPFQRGTAVKAVGSHPAGFQKEGTGTSAPAPMPREGPPIPGDPVRPEAPSPEDSPYPSSQRKRGAFIRFKIPARSMPSENR